MEPRFGQDFSSVRVHAGARAAEAARDAKARAYTVGRDVVFGAGQYAPRSMAGKRLLAHELAHVVQQRPGNDSRDTSIHRTMSAGTAFMQRKEDDTIPDTPKINHARAKRGNTQNAAKLGWDARLAEFKPSWAALWANDDFDAFADAVAAFQVELGLKGKAVDGVLGRFTWDRIRPIGEVIAKQQVSWPDSASVCTIAAEERLKKGFTRATGEKLVPKEESETFRIILQSIGSRMLEVDEQYRGTGAAGALVYLGKGEFVPQSDIWDKKALKPGAAMQVWKKKSALENLRQGKDEGSMGTAFVFVEYVGDDAMKVRHFDALETHAKSEFEVWIGANLLGRSPDEEAP